MKLRLPHRELVRQLMPIVVERGGIEIRDGHVHPVEHSPEAHKLAVSTLIDSLCHAEFAPDDPETRALQRQAFNLANKLAGASCRE